jgi:hypothetical protein
MKSKLLKWIAAINIIILLSVGIFFGEGILAHIHTYATPGPLSAARAAAEDEPISDYSSHADFEQECGHCHAPLHCITDTRCQDCHKSIAEQRITGQGLHSHFPGVEECEVCHVEHQGREASITEFAIQNLDHELLSGYSLAKHGLDFDGSPMNCGSCHSQDSFVSESLDCITCHVKQDHDYMAEHIELYQTDCVPCHDGTDSMAEFQHDDAFVLDGEHEDTDCLTCHIDHVFAGTPNECIGCHEEPQVHVGIFGFKCERCHNNSAWLPAQLTLHTFLIDHGVDTLTDRITCETCHMDTYTEYPCYSCHDRQEMEDYHLEIDIEAKENCVDCHPTGREDEADTFMETNNGL